MKQYPVNIISEVEAFRVKESEKEFLKFFKSRLTGKAIMKVTPFKSFYADMYYEEDSERPDRTRNILIKFMDTFEETFSILEEELIEIMEEEKDYFIDNLKKIQPDFFLNFVYFMPFVDLTHRKDEFSKKHIIDKNKFEKIKNGQDLLQDYMTDQSEIFSNLIRYQVAKEYHIIKKESEDRAINKDFKKIVFSFKDYSYQALPLTEIQMKQISSVKYGNTLYIGASGTGKTTVMFARMLKLSKIYPKDRFLYITFNKHLVSELNKSVDILNLKLKNIEIINFHSFILNISKRYSLKIDMNSKKDFNQQFDFIFRKISQIYTDYHIYKGIFIDEADNFKEEHFFFLKSLLYKSRNFFMVSADKAKEIRGYMKDFISGWENIQFEDIWEFKKNYRMTKNITNFTNTFIEKLSDYCDNFGLIIPQDYYTTSRSVRNTGSKVQIIRCEKVEQKLEYIISLIQELTKNKKLTNSDICIVFPFNKRKIKSGNTIYFQYILRESLQEAGIPFIMAHEDMTSLSYKNGVTVSNIFSISSLEFKVVILCELEMLYMHSLPEKYNAADAQSFIRSADILYAAMTRAIDSLYIITLTEKESALYNCFVDE